ncbi:MAG: UvrD-helicase domain-containing protein, partial [Pseudonocardia sp.]|nr:UvrD-helicase domain-containing protein [Pseudonocardia sp.]
AHRSFFDTIEKQPLTGEQAAAVVTFDNRVQVIAAAGSGKTSVMVARAAYSIMRDFVPADRILMLAFNKDAAKELGERVTARLGAAGIDEAGLQAATFHAFGLKVIAKATGRKKRLASWIDGGQDVAMVSRIVDVLRDSSPGFRWKWDMYRLLFARMADEPGAGEPDGYDYKARQTGFRTFNGEVVKSQGERMVADFLFLNGVNYVYERPYVHDVADKRHSQYRPDFYYPDVDVWHEHWALDRHGKPPAEFSGYAEGMAWKKALHRRHGTTLIETTWATIIDKSGFRAFTQDLESIGLTLDWNPDRPIRGAEPVRHEDLARLVRSFMAHVKSSSLTRADLQGRLAGASASIQKYRAQVFLDLYWDIHERWQQRLQESDSIDFEDMLVEAAKHLEVGHVDMGYDLVLVDEFQDASRARARLAKALVDRPHRHLLAVGDDWQSINRFAGADLSVMTSFNDWFGAGPTLRLQTTFRSPQSICDAASGFVAKNPRQFAKHVTSSHPDYGPPISLVRVARTDQVTRALSGVLSDLAEQVRSESIAPGPSGVVTVDVLGRYRFDRDRMPRRLPAGLTVTFRTVHSAKGLEADYILLPNVSSGTYGFPSEVVDDPVLSLAMAEADPYPHAEERRLFYVALTRAHRQVIMVGVAGRESQFVTELLNDGRLELSALSTVELSQPCPGCGHGVLVERKRRADGREFMGCSAFPQCTFTRAARNDPRQ